MVGTFQGEGTKGMRQETLRRQRAEL
jgi:hypothetical protein